jgi:4-amino-4-deoxy-L-arabinose transferase-like glycosyltransferase
MPSAPSAPALAPRPAQRIVLAALVAAALVSGWWGVGRQGLASWDEGVYFDEARFIVQALGAAPRGAAADIAATTTGYPPRMGRPLNAALNAVAMLVCGPRPWVLGALAGLWGALAVVMTYLLGRRLFGEETGLAAALLLLLSPYFLQYRRAGLPEAASALLALLVLSRLVALRERDEARPWLGSLGLGLMLGVAVTVNMRLGVLLPVVALFRLCWLPGARSFTRVLGHLLALGGGVGALLLACQLPYLALAAVAPGVGAVESYWQQLARFAVTQQHTGRPPLHLAYLAPFVFLGYFDLPALLLAAGVLASRRQWRQPAVALLAACLLAQLLALGFVAPFARYLSWTLPLLMILAAWGLVRLTAALRPRWGLAPAVGVMLLVLGHAAWRDAPVLRARGQMQAAADWLETQAPAGVTTSNASLLLAYYGPASRLPVGRPEAVDQLRGLASQGPAFVVLDRQRFMDGALLMPPERYDQSAGALIARVGKPVWQTQQFAGLFLPFAFEHNWDILQTLRNVRGRTQGERLAIYTATEALDALTP